MLGQLATEWARARQQLYNLLFPPRCVGCRQPGVLLCAGCLARVEYVPALLCTRCGRPVSTAQQTFCPACARRDFPLTGCYSVAYATGVMREAIHRLKYAGQSALAEPLAACLYAWWQQHTLPVDLIVAVPLHPRRQRQRGYNQAALLARRLSRLASLPYVEEEVWRVRDTRPQVGLNAAERRSNVAGAFQCAAPAIVGRRVLLIDDVRTTGATLEACAGALKAGGAASVWGLTLARAGGGPDYAGDDMQIHALRDAGQAPHHR